MVTKREKESQMGAEELERIAATFRAFGDATRLALLQELQKGESTVGELAVAIKASHANVSKHLQILRRAGLLDREKVGTSVTYSIRSELVQELCEAVCGRGEEV